MAARKRKKRKKKSHYKTGLHSSPKCKNSPMKYRSGWELVAAKHFDESDDVLCYEYESLKIPYHSNIRLGKMRNYIPDFLVEYTSGKKVLIEVKRLSSVNNVIVQKKAAAAIQWAMANNCTYEMWTNQIILPLKKSQEIKERYNSEIKANNNKKVKAK